MSRSTKESHWYWWSSCNFSTQRSPIYFSEMSQPWWRAIIWTKCSKPGVWDLKRPGEPTLLPQLQPIHLATAEAGVRRDLFPYLLRLNFLSNDSETFPKKDFKISPQVSALDLHSAHRISDNLHKLKVLTTWNYIWSSSVIIQHGSINLVFSKQNSVL